MRRSRAFILSEILMTMMLQAGFILVLCTSFYMLTSFYSKTQQVLTARSHAERAISFFDDKIKNAGLGLWRCNSSSSEVRGALMPITLNGMLLKNFKLPIFIANNVTDTDPQCFTDDEGHRIQHGDVLTVLYAMRDLSTGDEANVPIVTQTENPQEITGNPGVYKRKLKLIEKDHSNPTGVKGNFDFEHLAQENIACYAVTEGTGIPMYVNSIVETGSLAGNIEVYTYISDASDTKVADSSELMRLKCMQMFVHDNNDGEGKQLAFHEPKPNGVHWDKDYNQEKNILDIYMELDTSTNIFTLYVLAQGGYDASADNPKPKVWPDNANWDDDYKHYTVYVSRASWKLNNIPSNFSWD